MPTTRLEAFSDGVLAIIITIMVLELKVPEGDTFASLWSSTGGGLLSYLLSFAYVGIYWNNHHHLLHAVDTVRGPGLWANLNLLFWLSLIPFTTGWMDGSDFARTPVLVYGVVLLLAAAAYILLEIVLSHGAGEDSPAHRALRRDSPSIVGIGGKDRMSLVLYSTGIVAALLDDVVLPAGAGSVVAIGCYVAVALLWFIPDRRLESEIRGR